MSHVTDIKTKGDLKIKSLSSLKAAAARCGMVLRENQKHFNSYNGSKPPCDHAIALTEAKKSEFINSNGSGRSLYADYEVGCVLKKDGSIKLKCDFYGGGIKFAAGDNLDNLMMYYQAESAKRAAEAQGYMYSDFLNAKGELEANIDMTVKLGR